MSKQLDHKFVQIVKLKSLDGDRAVLTLPDGQELKWPKAFLPENLKVGQELRLLVHDKETDEKERQEIARTLLNELIK